ncbi:HNH endonuclease, partial [Geodermatophilus sp. CPCC 205761]
MESSVAAERSPMEGALVGWCLEQPATNSRLPVALLTKAEKAAEMQRLQARKAVCAGYEAELVLGLADDTPDTGDPPPGGPGAKRGSWAPDAEL